MKSARRGDNRSLDIQLSEAMSIEELTYSVKQLKKNMSYLIEFLRSQLDLIPAESAEEKGQLTKKRGFITVKIDTLSATVKNLLKEPSDDLGSIDSDKFIMILNQYKNTFTDILVDGRFLGTKDEHVVSKATLTLVTNDDYKAALAAIDKLVEAHYANALTNGFNRMVEEKNFSALANVKDFTKRHYDIDDEAAKEKLKMVFDKSFPDDGDKELRKAFFTAVADPEEENIMALEESCEYAEQEEELATSEVEENDENKLDDNEVKFTLEKAEDFINSTQMHREMDRQDDSAPEIKDEDNQQEVVKMQELHIKKLTEELKRIKKENEEMQQRELPLQIDISARPKEQIDRSPHKQKLDNKTLEENEKLRPYVTELEKKVAEKTPIEKKDSIPMTMLLPTPVLVSTPTIDSLTPLVIALNTFELMWREHAESQASVAKVSSLIDRLTKMQADKKATLENIMAVTKECVSVISTFQRAPLSLPGQNADHAAYVAWVQQATLQMQQERRKPQVVAIVSEQKQDAKVTKNDLYMIDNNKNFTEKDLGIIFAAIQAEGMKGNGWQVDAKKFTDPQIQKEDMTEFTVPLMLKKPSRFLWSNKQSVNLTFKKTKNEKGEGVLEMTSSPNDRIDTPLWNIVKGIQNAKETREFINKENRNPSKIAKKK